jgi:hypothetical protein
MNKTAVRIEANRLGLPVFRLPRFRPTLPEYENPVPGADARTCTPARLLMETPARRPPKLTPALFFPAVAFTPFLKVLVFR